MATYTSDQALDTLAPLYTDAGNTFTVVGSYDVTTAVVTDDIIEIVKIPGGATLLPCYFDNGGIATGFDVGTSSNATLIGSAVTGSGTLGGGVGTSVGSDGDEVVIRLKAKAAVTAAKTVKLAVSYIVQNID